MSKWPTTIGNTQSRRPPRTQRKHPPSAAPAFLWLILSFAATSSRFPASGTAAAFSPISIPTVSPLRRAERPRSDVFRNGGVCTKSPRGSSFSVPVVESSSSDGDVRDGRRTSTTTTNILPPHPPPAHAYALAGVASAFAWIAVSAVVLSHHPDPRFADCAFRHNALTISQAFAFPLPAGWAAFRASMIHSDSVRADDARTSDGGTSDRGSDGEVASASSSAAAATFRRLNLGMAAASAWLMASASFPRLFAFGYDLIRPGWLRTGAALAHGSTAILTLGAWWRCGFSSAAQATNLPSALLDRMGRLARGVAGALWCLGPRSPADDDPDDTRAGLAAQYGLCAAGLLWFSVLPVVSPYPLATIPTILGKRLSRPASAFTFLGGVVSYCIKDRLEKEEIDIDDDDDDSSADGRDEEMFAALRRGLTVGSSAHASLVLLKLAGADGGGLIFPGRGLWEVYPAMMAVPFSAAASVAVHALLIAAGCTRRRNRRRRSRRS
uniref:Uncharacterized protein n=1 Tax=Odontella aurita TaxID=265563 RepID=A0A7S4J4Q2_9STRA